MDSSSPQAEERRTATDLTLAGVICLLAAIFWFHDGTTAPAVAGATPPPAAVTTPLPAPVSGSAAFNNTGQQLYAASNFTGAEALFRQAIATSPNEALGYCNLGAALIAQHRYDEAITALQHAITLDPNFALARNNLQWALEEKKKQSK